MSLELLRSLVTVVAFACFVGIVLWVWSPSRRGRFERDAMLPFDDEAHPGER